MQLGHLWYKISSLWLQKCIIYQRMFKKGQKLELKICYFEFEHALGRISFGTLCPMVPMDTNGSIGRPLDHREATNQISRP